VSLSSIWIRKLLSTAFLTCTTFSRLRKQRRNSLSSIRRRGSSRKKSAKQLNKPTSFVSQCDRHQRNIRLIAIKQNLDIQQQDMNSKVIVTLFSLFSELERDLISLRTKEALSAKRARGQVLGKPKGTLQKSKFDQHLVRIRELLSYGLSVRKIARVLGYSSHIALNTYINKRGLHQVAKA
jgi:hypothetical protein